MQGLLYGVAPEPQPEPDEDNHLLRGLAQTPMRLVDLPDPEFLLPDWVVTRPRLTGVCGSDAKQVFMDWVNVATPDNPMKGFFSLPQVLGHEVVADVVALGPEAEGLDVGDRVVLNPWLSCRPRGVDPVCPACEAGDLSLCWSFGIGPIAPGIHTGTSRDASGGYAQLMPAHDTQLFKVPDEVPDELAVFADPFAVSLHSVTRHPPVPGGKVMVYGAGALGTCATAILRTLHPDVEVLVVARFEAQAALARKLGATVIGHEPARAVIEEAASWSGGVLQPSDGLPMAYPGAIDVVYDTIGKQETFEVGARVLKARGTLVKAGVHGPTFWEDTPLYFKELSLVGSNAFGFEEVDGVRRHGIAHYLDLVREGRVDLTGMLTHTFVLDDWRDAFTALATQDRSAAIKIAFDMRQN
ncbi:MAG TPA: alcohol dehydrogenase catalytic domain-containing protein [Acidimicrobiia bacterium]|jgi:threonine dehydrogenase-like Zn-dependent dehydrogenase|nr:alcohol dehydrogenase catalytic domain-containing protein [Acidimicrobiia bacterium]